MPLAPALVPAVVVRLLTPPALERASRAVVAVYLTFVAVVLAFVEIATYPFVAEYDSRPNHVFIGYLAYPREIGGMLWTDHKLALLAGVVAIVLTARLTWRAVRASLARESRWPWLAGVAVAPVAVGLLFLAARSSLSPRAANISTAAFSADHLANELALD